MSDRRRSGPIGTASIARLLLATIAIGAACPLLPAAEARAAGPGEDAMVATRPSATPARGALAQTGRAPVTATSPATDPAPPPRPAARRGLRDTADFRASVVRTAICLVALGVFAWGSAGRRRLSARGARIRRAMLVGLALVSYASYYQFFQLGHPEGFATSDNFHYYVGSKYFPELGYYGLYACGITALDDRGVRLPSGPDPKVRDLRSMDLWPAAFVRKHGETCRERFTPERWQAFSRDVGYFVEKWPPHIRNAVWVDHGYHPSPVWTLFGAAVANLAPTDSPTAMAVLARVDRVLIAATLLAVTWAFGLETGCLAAVLWGTGHLWRYTWLGDAFLRHLWWSAVFLGIAALRRGHAAAGGAGLATAALLRLFPGAFGLGYVLGLARQAMSGGRVTPTLLRFAAGATGAGVALIALALLVIGQGLAPIAAFAAKIGEFASVSATNKMGLGVVVGRVLPDPSALAIALRIAAAAGFATLFWRALRDALPWEAAALGFALIPWATDPTNYYYSFFVVGAVLAVRRPVVGIVLLATGIAWGIDGMVFYRDYLEFPAASLIALASTVGVAVAMTSRPVPLTVPPASTA